MNKLDTYDVEFCHELIPKFRTMWSAAGVRVRHWKQKRDDEYAAQGTSSTTTDREYLRARTDAAALAEIIHQLVQLVGRN